MTTDKTPGEDERLWHAETWGGVLEVRFRGWVGYGRLLARVHVHPSGAWRYVVPADLHRDRLDALNHAQGMEWASEGWCAGGPSMPF